MSYFRPKIVHWWMHGWMLRQRYVVYGDDKQTVVSGWHFGRHIPEMAWTRVSSNLSDHRPCYKQTSQQFMVTGPRLAIQSGNNDRNLGEVWITSDVKFFLKSVHLQLSSTFHFLLLPENPKHFIQQGLINYKFFHVKNTPLFEPMWLDHFEWSNHDQF